MGSIHIRTAFVFVMVLLLGCITACWPASTPTPLPTETPIPKGLVIENVYFSPPEPYNGKTYVVIEGTLPDGCTEIESIDHSWEYPTVHVTVTTSRPEGVACTQIVTPFKETIRVETGDIYEGAYFVVVNGERFEFPMPFDFIVPETPDPGS